MFLFPSITSMICKHNRCHASPCNNNEHYTGDPASISRKSQNAKVKSQNGEQQKNKPVSNADLFLFKQGCLKSTVSRLSVAMHKFPAESHAALDAASILTFIGRWIPGSSPRMAT